MFFPFLHSVLRRATLHWPRLLYAATWTVLLSLTVAMALFAPEIAFVKAISPSSSSWFSEKCNGIGLVRLPMDFPREVMCLPAHLARRSALDFFVPTLFAALVVSASACLICSLGLWDGGRD